MIETKGAFYELLSAIKNGKEISLEDPQTKMMYACAYLKGAIEAHFAEILADPIWVPLFKKSAETKRRERRPHLYSVSVPIRRKIAKTILAAAGSDYELLSQHLGLPVVSYEWDNIENLFIVTIDLSEDCRLSE